MELLSNLFGSLASGVIRLAVAVGIIAATYLFLVKPVLHTTDNAINKSFGPGGLGNIGRQIDHAIDAANPQVRRQVKRSIHQSRAGGGHDDEAASSLHPAGEHERQQSAGLRAALLKPA